MKRDGLEEAIAEALWSVYEDDPWPPDEDDTADTYRVEARAAIIAAEAFKSARDEPHSAGGRPQ